MDLVVGVITHFGVLSAAVMLAYLIQKLIEARAWKYILTTIFLIVSFIVVWKVDLEIPLNQSLMRDGGANLNYLCAALLSFFKYFGLCMVIFSFNSKKLKAKNTQ